MLPGCRMHAGHAWPLQQPLASMTISPSRALQDRDCERCRRPRRVCLCAALPDNLLRLRGKLVILQHPFESRRRMSTVPLLDLCLQDIITLRGRRFQESQELGAILKRAECDGPPVFLLFLGDDAADIRSAAKLLSEARHSRYQEQQTAGGGWRYVLVVVDGTWRQAKEMYKELRTWLPASVKAVHLPLVTAVDGPAAQDYLIRSQPDAICMSTMEAAARALGILENDVALEDNLLKPLRLMTSLQADFDPAIQSRLEQGNCASISGKTFGFKVPASIQSAVQGGASP